MIMLKHGQSLTVSEISLDIAVSVSVKCIKLMDAKIIMIKLHIKLLISLHTIVQGY